MSSEPRPARRDSRDLAQLVENVEHAHDVAVHAVTDLATIGRDGYDEETVLRVLRNIGRAAYWASAGLFEAARLGADVEERHLTGTYLDREHPDYNGEDQR